MVMRQRGDYMCAGEIGHDNVKQSTFCANVVFTSEGWA
jgi:hypothetical protein